MPFSSSSHEPAGGKDFVKQSNLYQEFLAEREEILRHKWLESERLGYDIGFERALLDWIRKHRDNWRAARRAGQTYSPVTGKVTASVAPRDDGDATARKQDSLAAGSGHDRAGSRA